MLLCKPATAVVFTSLNRLFTHERVTFFVDKLGGCDGPFFKKNKVSQVIHYKEYIIFKEKEYIIFLIKAVRLSVWCQKAVTYENLPILQSFH